MRIEALKASARGVLPGAARLRRSSENENNRKTGKVLRSEIGRRLGRAWARMMEGRKGDLAAATGLWSGQEPATSRRRACGGKRDKLAGVGGGEGGTLTRR